jgi:uncharacterized protein
MIAGLLARHSLTRHAFVRHLLAVLVALFTIAAAEPVLAQAPNPNPSPAAILLAKQILELKNSKDNVYAPLIRGVIEKAKNEFMQTNFMYAKDLNEVAAQLETQFEPRADELLDAAARIYAGHFTESDLKQILAWYQSPVGRKALVEEPRAFDEGLAYAGEWGQKFSDEVIVRMRDEMKKRGKDI